MKLVKNALGRLVPTEVNGRPAVPFAGVGKHRPAGRKACPAIPTCLDYPEDGNKLVPDLRTAIEKCGIRNGMTISTHHHFRDGDTLSLQLFDLCAEMGLRDLVWYPSAAFPCHAPITKHLDSGVIHHIEGSLNGPLGDYCTQGKMKGLGVLRSHGGRAQAIQDGEVHIDIAVLAAPAADQFGNANGIHGDAACGVLGYATADTMYADRSIIVTDNLVPFPCIPMQLHGSYIDHVVRMESIGDPKKILSGTTQITKSPDRLHVAELTARFIRDSGIMRDGFSFQGGAGGVSLAFAIFLADMMRDAGVKAGWMHGGTTRYLIEMLEQGLTPALIDGQAFDLDAIRSIAVNRGHVSTTPLISYNYHAKGNFINLLDVAVLGATEVDTNFNANVVTHSDGRLRHGIGGWQNCMNSRCVILSVPAMRDRMPVIVDEVTTICSPGELVDVIVTELGIAVNPLRTDLIEATKDKGLPIRPIQEIKTEVERICGKPGKPKLTDKVVAVVKWVDGTVLDSVYQTA
jgi:citrate lyase subunit alpha / citrate CoA-transferase